VDAAMDVAVVVPVEMIQGLKHGARLWGAAALSR